MTQHADNAEADNVDDEDLDAVLGALPANPFGAIVHANAVHIGAIA